MVHQLADDDIQTTGTEENTQFAEPMTGTDQTPENGNDAPSASSIKLTQEQLSEMILEFQGVYSQFKSAEVKISRLTKSNNNFKMYSSI